MMRAFTGKGFTLIELLITIVIMSMLLLLVTPMFRGGMTRDVNLLASNVASHLRYARSKSIASARTVTVNIDFDNRTLSVNETNKAIHIPKEIEVRLILDQAAFASKSANLQFYPNGASSGGVIQLSDERKKVSVTTSWLHGGVTIERI
jgi:general secretion pathway protein H